MVNRFILNEVSYFGPGARKELPGVVARLGFTKALVVTDKGLMKFGVAKMVLDVLDEAKISACAIQAAAIVGIGCITSSGIGVGAAAAIATIYYENCANMADKEYQECIKSKEQ